MPVAGVLLRSQCSVRIPPLGSPWDGPKVPYVRQIGGTREEPGVRRTRACGSGVPGGRAPGWILGGCYTGYYPSTLPVHAYWHCQGPTIANYRRFCVHPATPGPGWALRTPGLLALRYGPVQAIGRDSIIYILKLVNSAECHLKCSMRPGILPVSKTRPKVMTLNSQISNIASLLSQGINGPVLGSR